MFDEVFRALDKLKQGTDMRVQISLDDDGYFDRVCPSAECGSTFKVLFEDWKAKVPDDKAFCPICRIEAEPTEFNTPEQLMYFGDAGQAEITNSLVKAFQSSAEAFNRKQPRGFVTMQLHVNAPAVRVPIPPEAAEAMTIQVACEACNCHYAVIGVGYFCPACGHNSADVTFYQSIECARNAIAALPAIKSNLADRDIAAQVVQKLMEDTLGNLVTAFQYFAAVSYPRLPAATSTPRRNAFQNLTEGNELWHAAGGRKYADILGKVEMADLKRLFQQRHVLQHTQGIVDQEYLDRSGDSTYVVGQRIVVREQTVRRLADLLIKFANGMRADMP